MDKVATSKWSTWKRGATIKTKRCSEEILADTGGKRGVGIDVGGNQSEREKK
jgi:hypothetical protein